MTRIPPRPRARLHRRQGQRGISLVLVLLFLIILTLVGLAASMSSLSSERMARNTRDQNIALQAAEAALRDARNDIRNIRFISGVTGAALTCDVAGFKGFCLPAVTGKPAWDLYLEDPARSVELGEITLLTADQKMPTGGANGVSKQPRYLIESIPDINEGSLEAGNIKYVFRVSAIGYGANPSTKVMIQEVVRL